MSLHAIYMCRKCGYLYDQSKGDTEAGIEPGTEIDALPEDWRCPECGSDQSGLERVI